MRRKWLDGKGVAFAEYRDQLPASVRDWPFPGRVKAPLLLRVFAFEHARCAACDFRLGDPGGWLEIHHITGGTKGRSDEPTNLLRLCNECHAEIQGGPLGRVLWVKWKSDRLCLSWVRLAVLHRRFLPEPEPWRPNAFLNHSAPKESPPAWKSLLTGRRGKG